MTHERAGTVATSADLVDVAHLVTAYYTGVPDPDNIDQQVAFGTSGHRGSSLKTAFNEDHILATTQAIVDYRRSQGFDGPLFIGRDTHGLSEPAWATALEVLVANDVTVLVDDHDGYTPTPAVSHAILTANRGKIGGVDDLPRDRARGRHRRHAVAQPARRRRVQVQPAARRAGRLRRDEGIAAAPTPTSAAGPGRGQADPVCAGAGCGDGIRLPRPTYVDDLPNVVDIDAIKAAGIRIGADPLGGASGGVLGRDRRAPSGSTSPSSTRSSTRPGGS
jgi:phosphoglucomutase